MSEMVERVARAIIAGFDEITEPEEREDCLKLARAAIEAMREPTEGMLNTAMRQKYRIGAWKPDITTSYQAMIDEAMK